MMMMMMMMMMMNIVLPRFPEARETMVQMPIYCQMKTFHCGSLDWRVLQGWTSPFLMTRWAPHSRAASFIVDTSSNR
jgi:hypothetical protein